MEFVSLRILNVDRDVSEQLLYILIWSRRVLRDTLTILNSERAHPIEQRRWPLWYATTELEAVD